MFKPCFIVKLFLPMVPILIGLSLSFNEITSFFLEQVLESRYFLLQVSCRAMLPLQRIAASSEGLALMLVAIQLFLAIADLLTVLVKPASQPSDGRLLFRPSCLTLFPAIL